MDILGFGCLGPGRVVQNKAYSATVSDTHVQLLYPSGTQEQRTTTETVFRDASGDTYRQTNVSFEGQNRQVICINLASGDSYVLDPSKMTARKFTRRPPLNFQQFGNGGNGGNPPNFQNRPNNGATTTSLDLSNAPENVKEDASGFGCAPTGTQTTRGQAPLQVVTQRWFCSSLGIVLYTQTTDPQRGQTTMAVTLNSNQPPSFDPSVFLSGYTVTDEPPRGRGGRRGPPPPPQQ